MASNQTQPARGSSKGNPATNGVKKNNHSYQHNSLLILGEILNNTPAPPVGGLATEATLLGVLSAVDSMRDYEVRLVVDSDAPPVTWLEVRYWDAQDGTLGAPVYYPPGSTTPGAPVGALFYINPNSLLAAIEGELMALNTTASSIDAKDFATELTLSGLSAKFGTLGQKSSAGSAPVVLSTEQEAILTAMDAVLDNIYVDTQVLATPATGLAVSLTRATGAGAASVPAGKRRVSFFNAGNTDATVAGATLERGEFANFNADGLRDTLAAISYNPLTSTLLISTVG